MNTTELYKAMLAVQQASPAIDKSASNPFFKSKYADLPTVWAAIRDLMGTHGLLVSHSMEIGDDGDDFICTRIIHAESGGILESKSRILLGKATAQDYGSYITYMRRYALTAMLGLVTDEDDDGNKASTSSAVKTSKPVKAAVKKDAPDFKALINALTTEEEFKAFRAEYKDAIQESADKEKIVAYFNKKKEEVANG